MLRNRILVAAGVAVALGAAGCSGTTSGNSAGPTVPTFESTKPTPVASNPSSGPSTPPPASTPGEQTPTEVADPGECKVAELKLSIGHGDATAGTVFRPLRFTNSGGRTCTMQGFPGVSYVAGDDGHQVGPAAFREGTKGAPVSLAPGETAFATVGFVQVHNFDPNVCKPTAVRGLRVYPPHEFASLFLPLEGTGCAGTPPGNQLTVRTVQKGQGGV
jgi:Protein of unknown function (DUF4232)